MAWIHLDSATQARADALARERGLSLPELLRCAVDALSQSRAEAELAPDAAPRPEGKTDWIAVHCRYMGRQVQGLFQPDSLALRITSAPWHDQEFPTPTAAAVAVLAVVNPSRASPATNGRRFWRISDTGLDLRSLVGKSR